MVEIKVTYRDNVETFIVETIAERDGDYLVLQYPSGDICLINLKECLWVESKVIDGEEN